MAHVIGRWNRVGGRCSLEGLPGQGREDNVTLVFSAPDAGAWRIEIDTPDEKEQIEEAAPQAEQERPLQGPEGEALPSEGGIGGESPLPDAGPEKVEVVEGVGGEPQVDVSDLLGVAAGLRSHFQEITRVREVPNGFARILGPEYGESGIDLDLQEMTAFERVLADNAQAVADAASADPDPEPPVNAAWKMAHDLGALISTARGALDDLQVAACHAIDNGNACEGRLTVKESDDTGTVTAEVQWPYNAWPGGQSRDLVARFVVEGKLLKVEE